MWSSLVPEGVVGTVSDLSLKHGADISGDWSVLGVLDAVPDSIPAALPVSNVNPAESFETLIKNFANITRTALGRPAEAYGATALLIFRQVSASGV
jgi:hypothetical protein